MVLKEGLSLQFVKPGDRLIGERHVIRSSGIRFAAQSPGRSLFDASSNMPLRSPMVLLLVMMGDGFVFPTSSLSLPRSSSLAAAAAQMFFLLFGIGIFSSLPTVVFFV